MGKVIIAFPIGLVVGVVLGFIGGYLLGERADFNIETRPMGSGWQAFVAGDEDNWEFGHTEDEAISKLVSRLRSQ